MRPAGIDVSSGVERRPASRTRRGCARCSSAVRGSGGVRDDQAGTSTERAVFGQRDPDARGYFGEFGGRFVPETLMAPVEELTRRVLPRRARTRRSSRSSTRCCSTTSAGRRRSTRRRRLAARRRRRAHLPQARGPRAHRRAQDQQRARSGAARRGAWASAASSPRPAPDSTAWRPRPSARCSASSASSTWAPRTWRGRR